MAAGGGGSAVMVAAGGDGEISDRPAGAVDEGAIRGSGEVAGGFLTVGARGSSAGFGEKKLPAAARAIG